MAIEQRVRENILRLYEISEDIGHASWCPLCVHSQDMVGEPVETECRCEYNRVQNLIDTLYSFVQNTDQ
jgi:hypothetical protein